MEFCYWCEKEFNNNEVQKHGEHVIQNALGGRLIIDNILCESCGCDLGTLIDHPFIEKLAPFTTLLNLARNRGESSADKTRINIFIRDGIIVNDNSGSVTRHDSIEFTLRSDFSITPSRPCYTVDDDKKILTMFVVSDKQLKNFCQNKTIKKYKESGYEIISKTDISDFISNATININRQSKEILLGVLKIATGFSMKNGIKTLPHLKKFSKDIFGIENVVWDYYPTSDEEKIYETGKYSHEDWYPNHQIYLFNIRNDLFCYVELFGVIQKYVHLSDKYYERDICEKYIQKTIRWDFKKEDWIVRSCSDMDIMARQFNINYGDWDKMQRDILQAAESRGYIIDPDTQLEKISTLIHHVILFNFSDIKDKGFEIVDWLNAKAGEAKNKFGFALIDKIDSIKNHNSDDLSGALKILELSRKTFDGFRINNETDGCPYLAKNISETSKNTYFSYKLFELLSSLKVEKKFDFIIANDNN